MVKFLIKHCKKIGKTMKNYNILKYIYENENEDVLDDYVTDLKKG